MTIEVRIPKLGMGMEQGTLVEWLVKDGGAVTEGEPFYTLESDKANQDIEATASGVLRVVAAAGETYDVGALIAHIE